MSNDIGSKRPIDDIQDVNDTGPYKVRKDHMAFSVCEKTKKKKNHTLTFRSSFTTTHAHKKRYRLKMLTMNMA